jgi:hypothetical protein
MLLVVLNTTRFQLCETRDGNCTYDCIEGFNGDGCNIADLIRLAPGEQ